MFRTHLYFSRDVLKFVMGVGGSYGRLWHLCIHHEHTFFSYVNLIVISSLKFKLCGFSIICVIMN